MKKIFTLISILSLSLLIQAQENDTLVPDIPEPIHTTNDSSNVKMIHINGNKVIIYKKSKKVTHKNKTASLFTQNRNRIWQGFEIGFNQASYGPEFNTNAPTNAAFFTPRTLGSITWSINPIEFDIRIIGEYVKFSTGLGYTAKNFSLQNNYRLQRNGSGITTGIQEPTTLFSRNRFRTGYITIPAILHFNTKSNSVKSFRLGVGAVFGVRVFETYRLKYHINNHKHKEKIHRSFNSNPMMLDLKAIIGYRNINFFATYSTMSLFNNGFGPEIHPFSIGISLINND